jgi:hypothetical protein
MALTTLNRSKSLIFLDTGDSTSSYNWTRIDKSTVFDLQLNAETVDYDFIDDDNTVTELDKYKPTMDQEIVTVDGNPMYEFMENLFYQLPSGEDAKRPALVVFPRNISTGSTASYHAWLCPKATLTIKNFNSQDKKIYWNIAFGNITKGTATVNNGVPVFSANA